MNKLQKILKESIEFSFDYVTLLDGDIKKVLRIREYYGNQEIMLDLMSLDSMSLESITIKESDLEDEE